MGELEKQKKIVDNNNFQIFWLYKYLKEIFQ